MITRKYNIVNNTLGWVVFAIALATYWLTLEPTASYWDCGEFIIQADKLEVGHPPGNPIFMLTARAFANFAPDDAHISVMVNAMSGLLSALTILLLFWTITHLVRRLLTATSGKHADTDLTLTQYVVTMGSGIAGALAYCWSDTFWFSAVEGEVYAFSSFCTALVFWLILKWENRADNPGSDRYLILIAYIIGVSIAVHLLNLLCIPAIVLVFAYRKFRDMDLVKSLVALGVSFLIVALVLFGLVPGFIKMAQQFELTFVNGFHLPFNTGAIVYAFTAAAVFVWAVTEINLQKSSVRTKTAIFMALLLSGIFFFGSGWWLGWVLLAIMLAFMVSKYWSLVPRRVMNVIMWSIAVIFVGYSSYALILIRSSADTPMNQNAPDNVFDLASYLNREQYGETPLLYGHTLYSGTQKEFRFVSTDTMTYSADGKPILAQIPAYEPIVDKGKPLYAKGVTGAETKSEYGFLDQGELASNAALAKRGGDYYVKRDYKGEVRMNPELNMLFPRIHSRQHAQYYPVWVNMDTVPDNLREIHAVDRSAGEKVPEFDFQSQPYLNEATGMVNYPQKFGYRPTLTQNLAYFFNYQLIHMYMRYFLWNFAGRQNDLLNQQGELDAGNWISGIPFIDNPRLGDQSLLPPDLGKENRGHNTYYLLPLILGILGLLWQAFEGKKGIEQFWVVFFLFFMTGIAIVLYLNQPPMQPRERDYAFAGSFYAYAIWIGMGVAALWKLLRLLLGRFGQNGERHSLYAASAAAILGLAVPLQMVSQTWDDHDRSGRYAARDFAINYLESLEPDAIVFCNGDNDTFPLWYAQEVEGVRPDVKIVNLSYLASDWYADQMRRQSYTAPPLPFTATKKEIAYGNLDVVLPGRDRTPVDLRTALIDIYAGGGRDNSYGYPMLPSAVVTVPVDKKAVVARGLIAPADTASLVDEIVIDLGNAPSVRSKGYVSLSELLMLDIIATNAAQGWQRPIYWCTTVGEEYHLGLSKYLRGVGMTHQLVPTIQEGMPARNDRAYDVVTKKYRWGGADNPKSPYFDETARRMTVSTRNSMLDVASELLYEGRMLESASNKKDAATKYRQAVGVIDLMDAKILKTTVPYSLTTALQVPEILGEAGEKLGDAKVKGKALRSLEESMKRFAPYLAFARDAASRFGNPSLTIETRMMPYQFYRFIELYEKYGGKAAKAEEILKPTGYNVKTLKEAYGYAYGSPRAESGATDAAKPEVSKEELLAELADAARTVNRLAGMSDAEYAAAGQDDRYVDSIYYAAYLQYEQLVGKELLGSNPDIAAVDLARSKRIGAEFDSKSH